MSSDVLIIGQGLCGTFLHWYLSAAGMKCIIADYKEQQGASEIAAGIINPVTGRRLVKTWMIDELMPFACNAYQSLEKELNIGLIAKKDIVDFFPSLQMRQAFIERVEATSGYLSMAADEKAFDQHFRYELGFGLITPAYLVQPALLISAYRNNLKASNEIVEFQLDHRQLQREGQGWKIGNLQARYVVFCDGINGMQSEFFKNLPFAPNKGEVLYIEVKGLPDSCIYKKGINLVPVEKDIYWVGSSYEWAFADDRPTPEFLNTTNLVLKNWLKTPFKIIDHRAAIRPATLERRPFVGMHPDIPTLGILNGMGTKGCTLAPYFANQLSRHLTEGRAILPEASIQRFRNVMAREHNIRNST